MATICQQASIELATQISSETNATLKAHLLNNLATDCKLVRTQEKTFIGQTKAVRKMSFTELIALRMQYAKKQESNAWITFSKQEHLSPTASHASRVRQRCAAVVTDRVVPNHQTIGSETSAHYGRWGSHSQLEIKPLTLTRIASELAKAFARSRPYWALAGFKDTLSR